MENPAALFACIRRAIAAALFLALALTIMPLGARAEAFTQRVPAPNFAAKVWLNSRPLTRKQLHGKVVLIDVWEYTCINCIRTFPYLRRWRQLYAPAGLVIIGVHTPEFGFGKNPKNVANAVKRFGFTFPIAVDSDSDIWNAFRAGGWPTDYLIDKGGNIAYVHSGEGDYAEMEREIQTLLKERNPKLNFASARYAITKDEEASMMGGICRRESPETYLGFLRGNNIANPGGEDRTMEVHYLAPSDVPLDNFALNGDWLAGDEYVRHTRSSSGLRDAVQLHYQAKSVYLVAGSDDATPRLLYITQDGNPLPANARGVDVKADASGRTYIELTGKRMYYVAENPAFETHTLALYAITPGVSLYSFTFGNNCESKFAHR